MDQKTLRPEQSEEERLPITHKIRDATKRNETDSENIERDIRVEDLLLPRDAVTETDRMVPDVSSAAGTLVKAREKTANVRNERERVREWQTEKSPNRTNATQPKPDKKRVVNITDGGRRAVVPPGTRRQVSKGATGSHIATRDAQRKGWLNNSSSRKHENKPQKTRKRRRLWDPGEDPDKKKKEVTCVTNKEPEKRQTRERPVDPGGSETMTADGTEKRLNNSGSRTGKKKSHKAHERRRSWGVKRPWKWRVPRTKSRERNNRRRGTG